MERGAEVPTRESASLRERVGVEARGGHARVQPLTELCVEVCVETGSACAGRVRGGYVQGGCFRVGVRQGEGRAERTAD